MRFILSVTLAAAALVAAAALADTAAADGRNPTVSALSRYVKFSDKTFARARSAGHIAPSWPFSELTASGETVDVHLSQQLFQQTDSDVAQKWADFFDSLVHGPELSTLHAYLMKLSEVQDFCGAGALACYGQNTLVAPADDPAFDLSAESVAAHEYGHHVAAHRIDTPWEAIDYGTKRWSSYENVCLKARKDVYYPGDESEAHYFYNPGEGFAEAYRVLNEHKLGLPEAPWDIVTNALYPDDTALNLLEQDVTSPWTKNTTLMRSGSVSARAKTRSFVITTPLDGRLTVRLTSSAKARFRLDILSPTSTTMGHASGKNATVGATICGQRALRVRVNDVKGAGAFKLAISRP